MPPSENKAQVLRVPGEQPRGGISLSVLHWEPRREIWGYGHAHLAAVSGSGTVHWRRGWGGGRIVGHMMGVVHVFSGSGGYRGEV